MLRYLKKIITYNKSIRDNTQNDDNQNNTGFCLSSKLDKNLITLKDILGDSNDIIIKEFSIENDHIVNGSLVYLEGMVNKLILDESILKPLVNETSLKVAFNMSNIDMINKNLHTSYSIKKISQINDLLDHLLSGDTILLVDDSHEALVINTKEWEKRSIDQPLTENVVRGPREGFTENLSTNITLIRRKIKCPDLRIETYTIGNKTKTKVCIMYVKDIVNPKLITEIKLRLDRIKIDAILDSGYIETLIEDAPYSIFATVGNSEKPDATAGKLLEGRAAILVDGTPFVLTVPLLFIECFQTSEDYYSRPYFSSVIRLLRFMSYFITILAPATYVALTTFHQELIPTQLLFTMAAGHYDVPFTSLVEALIMLIIFEILREGGIRLPKPIGSAISIVGAIILGESAVSAGLISPFMVIVVSLTAISSFVIPSQTDSSSILRYFFLIISGFLGAFGIIMGLLMILIHLSSLRSFGTPYLWPIAPFSMDGMKDTYIRVPLWAMLNRPKTIGKHNPVRQKKSGMMLSQFENNNENNN